MLCIVWCKIYCGYKQKKRHQKIPLQQNGSKLKQSYWTIYSPNMGINILYPSYIAGQEWLVRKSIKYQHYIPVFFELDSQPKKSKRTSLVDTIIGAAATFANAVKSPKVQQCNSQSVVISSPNSPCTPTVGGGTSTMSYGPGYISWQNSRPRSCAILLLILYYFQGRSQDFG